MQVRAPVALSLAALQLWLAAPVRADDPAQAPAAGAPMLEVPSSASNAMDAEARQHFQLGRAFYDSGRFREAAEEFGEAYRLSKRPELLYNVYVANRDAGRLEAAVEALRGYLAEVTDAPDSVNLRARLAALEAQLTQREEEARSHDRAIAEAQARAAAAATAQRVRTERVQSPWPWVLIGTGAAAGAAAAVTGGLALGKRSQLEDVCVKNTCRSSSSGEIDALSRLSITTDVLIGTGAALVVAGLVLRLTHALDTERELPQVSAFAGPHQVGTSFSTRF